MLAGFRRILVIGGASALLLAGVSSPASPALAVDSEVSDIASLREAVEALPSGASTITLASDFEPVGAVPTITIPSNVDLTLQGADTGTEVTKASGVTGRHLVLSGDGTSTVAIAGIDFLGPNSPDPSGDPGGISGGGVSVNNVQTLTVTDSSFSGIDGSSGLAVDATPVLNVSRSSFLGNRASASAAISVPSAITVHISDSTVAKNAGTWPGYAGGAIQFKGDAKVTIERTVFTDNVSGTRGGAIAFHQMAGSLTVNDSYFEGNRVPQSSNNNSLNDGGAISVTEQPITGAQRGRTVISGTTFVDNVAADEGGAILAHSGVGSQVLVKNSTFFGNVAQGLQTNFDDSSGGGAIEAFGTPLTLLHNTFVNNIAEAGNVIFGTQRGGAVSMYGNSGALPTQPLVLSHNLFVGNDVLTKAGASATSSAYRQVSASAGIESPAGELPPAPEPSGEEEVPSVDDLELVYPDLTEAQANAAAEALALPVAADSTNIGVDAGVAIDLSVINRESILGTDVPVVAANGSSIVAGDPNGSLSRTPGTILFLPKDSPYLEGLADNVGVAADGIDTDQRGFPVDVPADAGSVQQAFVRYDPNGGDWADYVDKGFLDEPGAGERIVARDGTALVWAVGAVGADTTTEPIPTTAPEGMQFAGWNTAADGSGDDYAEGAITIPAGNLRLYAQWSEIPVPQGTVTLSYLDENGEPLREVETLTGPVGDPYSTEQLDFPGYDFVRVEGAPSGTYGPEPVAVTYHYKKQPAVETGTVVVSYVDENGTELRDAITLSGDVGEAYSTEQLSFPGYEFVRVEGEPSGSYTAESISVRYHYSKQVPAATGTVVAEYVNHQGAALREPITTSGEVGDAYETKQLTFDGYTFDRVVGAPSGTITDAQITVTYVYRPVDGSLPSTGNDGLNALMGIGVGVLAAGAAVLLLRRKRSSVG